MLRLEQINDDYVHPIKIKADTRPVRGGSLCDCTYANMFLVAPTNSGKTSAIFKILKECAGKKTKIIVFSSTFFNDPLWEEIRNHFDKKGIEIDGYLTLKGHLQDLITELQDKAIERQKKGEVVEEPVNDIDMLIESLKSMTFETFLTKERKKVSKYQSPEYILVFDDLSNEIQDIEYETLLKQSRHFHIKTITSSQGLIDITPTSRQQVRVWMLWKGLSVANLRSLYTTLGLNIPFDLFQYLYSNATTPTEKMAKPFLYFIPKTNEYRKSFTHKYIIPENLLE